MTNIICEAHCNEVFEFLDLVLILALRILQLELDAFNVQFQLLLYLAMMNFLTHSYMVPDLCLQLLNHLFVVFRGLLSFATLRLNFCIFFALLFSLALFRHLQEVLVLLHFQIHQYFYR